MRILVVSDTHGICNNLIKVLKKVGKIDFLIHAGDVCGDEDVIESLAGCPCKMVAGNNDYSPVLEREELFDVDGHLILLTHGHRDGVYYGTDRLFYRAAELGADIVIYGHTHVPGVEYDEENEVWAVNPGSLTFPRQEGRKPSYILMETDDYSEVHFAVNFL